MQVEEEVVIKAQLDEQTKTDTVETSEEGAAPLLALDEKEIPVEVATSDGEVDYIVSHVLVKPVGRPNPLAIPRAKSDPYLNLLLEREAAIKREHEKVGENKSKFKYSEDRANSVLYDGMIARVVILDAERKPFDEMSADEAKSLPFEQKSEAVKLFYQSHVDLEKYDDSDRLAFLRGRQKYRVTQLIGEKKNPSFVLRYELNRPSDTQRLEYQENINDITYSTEDKDESMEMSVNLLAAVTLFDQIFSGVEGATVAGKAYEPEARAEFLRHIDPLYKYQMVTLVMNSFALKRRD
ncbi:MAG TPA: hypothetical protein VGB17_02930 [Pyrinomonadaceae bacterium]|jgi:hypothetical protein